ncbi:MAG: hypothetical protein IPN86_12170 [Saprospiraceae bacterium]|nr:hypothetical protein [Saprospiraceae bacterium]
MKINILTYILVLVAMAFRLTPDLSAQDQGIINYTDKKSYEIGGIEIVGAETRDRNAIKSIANLKEGGKVQIPGPAIPAAIKSLLKLRLFDDVQIYQVKTEGNIVFLKIILVERPILSRWSYKGVKSSQQEDLNDVIKNILTKGGIVTDDQKDLAKTKIKEFYIEKGKLNVTVKVNEIAEESKNPSVRLEFIVDPKNRVKVEDIVFEGNKSFSSRKLRKQLDKTKRKGTLLKKSKYIEKEYQEDIKSLTKFYQKEGFKNMSITQDTTYINKDGNVMVNIKIDEGNRHYFRDIKWKGNTLYTNDYLYTILGIAKGDIYNPEITSKQTEIQLGR